MTGGKYHTTLMKHKQGHYATKVKGSHEAIVAVSTGGELVSRR